MPTELSAVSAAHLYYYKETGTRIKTITVVYIDIFIRVCMFVFYDD